MKCLLAPLLFIIPTGLIFSLVPAVGQPPTPVKNVVLTHKVMVPGLKKTVTFQGRQRMKKGHPLHRARLHHPIPTTPIKLPIDWTKGWTLSYPMDLNDQVGDC